MVITWLSIIAIFTLESVAFLLTSGFYAETLMIILKVKISRQKNLLRVHRK